MISRQIFLTPSAGKRLIAMALRRNPEVLQALREHMVVIVAGTTNAFLAEELLDEIGEKWNGKYRFFRGIVRREAIPSSLGAFEGDVVIDHGIHLTGKNLRDVADDMRPGDIIFKGANAVNLQTGEAAVLAGNPTSGTMGEIYRAVVGRRVRLLTPVGVEKRVDEPMNALCALCNNPFSTGLRLAPSPGEAYTELKAIHDLSGMRAHLVAAGGVCGCEGGAFFQCEGTREQMTALMLFVGKANRERRYTFR